jgi:hypothetical protein
MRIACGRDRQRAGVLPYRQWWLPERASQSRTVSEQTAVAALVRCRRMRIGLMGCRVVDQASMTFAPTPEIGRPRRGGDGLRDHRRDDGEPHGEQPQPCNQPSMSRFTDQEPVPVSSFSSMIVAAFIPRTGRIVPCSCLRWAATRGRDSKASRAAETLWIRPQTVVHRCPSTSLRYAQGERKKQESGTSGENEVRRAESIGRRAVYRCAGGEPSR